jgi:hypothetical protein
LDWAVDLAGVDNWKIGPARREMVELLLDHHADPNVKNNNGKTPLDLLKDIMAQNWAVNNPTELKAFAKELADLLRQHGALDNPTDWDHIQVSCLGSDYSATVFQKNTNDWNRFTLLETVLHFYESTSLSSSWAGVGQGVRYPFKPGIPFPDLSRVTIMRPSQESTNVTRIKVNLLNDTNGIDCSKDVPLKFGDTVEIPEREHTLAESDTNGPTWIAQISSCLRSRSSAVKLIVAGGQTIQLQLYQFVPFGSGIGVLLGSSQAQSVLTSDSDLSRVKVTRRDPKTGRKQQWVLDCSVNGSTSDLWLRNGDVIEVPEKP